MRKTHLTLSLASECASHQALPAALPGGCAGPGLALLHASRGLWASPSASHSVSCHEHRMLPLLLTLSLLFPSSYMASTVSLCLPTPSSGMLSKWNSNP